MHRAVKAIWEAVPKPVQDVVATTLDRANRVVIPDAPMPARHAPVRLFVAPANYAGQGWRWARAAEHNPRVTARNMVYAEINPFDYDADFPVRGRTVTHSRRWQRAQAKALTGHFTHLLVEAEMPPLGGLYDHDVRRQIRELQAGGLSVGMVSHGSDIRLPSRHRRTEPWSPFANDDWVSVEEVEAVARENRAVLDDLVLPTFVSTAGLLLDVPYAHLLPIVIEPAVWRSDAPVLQRSRPRVVHVPSNPLIKGTAEIEPALRRLDDEGLIEYVTVVGRSHAEMPGIIGDADIVLDQFRLGDYGAAACEAMAAGRLVVSHVSSQVREAIREISNASLPILEADIGTLDSVLREVVARPAPYRALAGQGPGFVQRVHDGALSRAVLERHFLAPDEVNPPITWKDRPVATPPKGA